MVGRTGYLDRQDEKGNQGKTELPDPGNDSCQLGVKMLNTNQQVRPAVETELGTVADSHSPHAQEAEVGGLLQIQGQPRVQ